MIFSVCFLYRKAIGLFRLILYTATLLNLFIISRSFLVQFLESVMCIIISSVNRDFFFTSSFTICIPLFFFFCHIAPESTSGTILKRNQDSGHPVLTSSGLFQGFLQGLACCCLWVSHM